MVTIACIVAGIAVLMLFGQYLSGTADYYLSIENPRPLDDNIDTITIKGWGFASESSRSRTADLAGQGLADVRLSPRASRCWCRCSPWASFGRSPSPGAAMPASIRWATPDGRRRDRPDPGPAALAELPQDRHRRARRALRVAQRLFRPRPRRACRGRGRDRGLAEGGAAGRRGGPGGRRRLVAVEHTDRRARRLDAQHPPLQPVLPAGGGGFRRAGFGRFLGSSCWSRPESRSTRSTTSWRRQGEGGVERSLRSTGRATARPSPAPAPPEPMARCSKPAASRIMSAAIQLVTPGGVRWIEPAAGLMSDAFIAATARRRCATTTRSPPPWWRSGALGS